MYTQTTDNHLSFHNLLKEHAGLQPNNRTALIAANSLSRRIANMLAFLDTDNPLVSTSTLRDLRSIMIGIHSIAILVGTTPLEAMYTKWAKKGYLVAHQNLEADFKELKSAIRAFYDFRYSATHGYPSAYYSASFLLSEAGELVAEFLQATGEFIRNNPEKSQGSPIIYELGDVYQMFLVTCIQLNVDPFEQFQ